MLHRRFRKAICALAAILCIAVLAGCDSREEREARYVEHGTELFAAQDYQRAALEFRNALQINPSAAAPQYYLGLIAERQANAREANDRFGAAADRDPKNPDYALAAGKLALLGGDLDGAQKRADAALVLRPDSAAAHALKAAVLLKRGHLSEAEAEESRALALDPKNDTAIAVTVGLALQKDDRTAASALLEKGIVANPQSEALLLLRLAMAGEDKDLAAAKEALGRLVEIQPDNGTYWLNLVRLSVLLNQPDVAETTLRAGVAARPEDKNLRLLLVRLLAARGRSEQAEQELRTAIEAHPDEPAYRLGMASFYKAEGRLDDARGILRGLIAGDVDAESGSEAKLAYARLAVAGEDIAGAKASVDEVLEADRKNPDALVIRAGLAMTERNFDAAIADLRVVLSGQPNHVRALILLCSAYDAAGQQDLALDCRRRYLVVNPGADAVRVEYARRLMQAGSNDVAATEIAQVLSHDPRSVPARLVRIDLRINRQDWAGAEEDARSVLALGQVGIGHAALGRVFFAQQRFGDAIAALVAARHVLPDDPDLLALLVAAHLELGDIAGARSEAAVAAAGAPQDPAPHVALADIAFRDGEAEQAEAELRTAIALRPNWSLPYLKLGSLLRGQHRIEDALMVFNAGLEQAPHDPDLLLKLALTEDLAGRFESAWTHYHALLQVAPKSVVGANNMASLAADIWPQDTTRLDLARRLTERFRNSTDPMLMDTLGWVQVRLGNTADATLLLERAVAGRPGDPQLRYHLGMAYLAQNDAPKARAALAVAAAASQDYRGKPAAIRAFTELSSR